MTKRIIVPALLIAMMANDAVGQNVMDALRFSENNYYGTARSVGLGNAVTALGGDLGSVGINPAGSAVNSFSQFTITPGLSVFINGASYNGNPSHQNSYDSKMNRNRAGFILPDISGTITIKTGRTYGVKHVTFGVIGNSTSYYTDSMEFMGNTNKTSFLGELAAFASDNKLDAKILDKADYINSVYPYTWDAIVGYKSGMIATYGGSDTQYVGSTEKIYEGNVIATAGMLDQRYGRRRTGSKTDFIMNAGLNISDFLYLGANIGIVSISSKFSSYYKEAGDLNDPNFDIDFGGGNKARFSDFRFRQTINIEGSGVYGKFGFILRPIDNLRLGAAIQTPVTTYFKERYQCAGETHFDKSNFDSSAQSAEGIYDYRLVSPYRFNAGAAFTFSKGLVSLDYEMCDYSAMKYKETESDSNSGFANVNDNIQKNMGTAHMLRAGVEFKATEEFALRAGYNLSTSPERYYEDNVRKTPQAYKHAVSLGIGYNSPGSFFWDLAGRYIKRPNEFFYPYGNYIKGTASPEVLVSRSAIDVVMTFGWRF